MRNRMHGKHVAIRHADLSHEFGDDAKGVRTHEVPADRSTLESCPPAEIPTQPKRVTYDFSSTYAATQDQLSRSKHSSTPL